MTSILIFLFTLPLLFSQGAVESHCADCHFANPVAPGTAHLYEWELSPHGRKKVGCESCHGGEPTRFEELAAHRTMLSPRNPASPVARRQLPGTCGKCHIGPFVSFQKSRHFELLQEGDRRTPICSTCHGDVGAHLLSPLRLEKKCGSCHDKAMGSRGQDPARARQMLEGIERIRARLESARMLIRQIQTESRRQLFEENLRQAEVPLIEAVDLGHSFDFREANERLDLAASRSLDLLAKLANP